MARKKKSKKKSKPERATNVEGEDSSSGGKSSPEKKAAPKKRAPKKKATPTKKRAPKKKRARKKAAKKEDGDEAKAPKAESKSRSKARKPPPKKESKEDVPDAGPTPALEDAEEASSAKKASKKVSRRKAEVPEETEASPAPDPVSDEVPDTEGLDSAAAADAEDVDAVLDGDPDDSEDLDALIASAASGAPEDGADEVVAVGDEESVEVLDIEADETESHPYSEAADAAAEVPSEDDPARAPEAPEPSTEEQLAGAIDLGDVSSPEIRDRILAQALAHAEMQDARYRVPFSDPRAAGRWKAGLAVVLFLVAAVLAVAPPGWVRPAPPARIDADARARNVRRALLLQAQQVDAYRVRTQRLPASLEDLPERLDGIRYVRSGNRAFQLIAYPPGGGTIVYDSSNPAAEFQRLARSWAVGVTR